MIVGTCKLHEIHFLVDTIPCSYNQNLKEQVVLTICSLAHGVFTYSCYFIK